MGKKNAHLLLLYISGEKKKKNFYFGHSSAIGSTKKKKWMRINEKTGEWMRMMHIYFCLLCFKGCLITIYNFKPILYI